MQSSRMNTYLAIFLSAILGLQPSRGDDVERSLVLETWHDDADLHDVTFVDHEYGWAVGDHGTIWHTQNGGEIWRRQSSTVSVPLRSVHFVDRNHGWAAGGAAIPMTQMSRGIVLKTEDGGKSWVSVDGLLLPWINGIHFSTAQHGIAIGHASSSYPTGVWTTNDGGRTWSPVSGERGVHWLHADFQIAPSSAGDSFTGLLRGHDGRVGRVANDSISTSLDPPDAWWWHPLVSIFNPTVGFAGSEGISVTPDGGRSWQSLGRFRPESMFRQMRWQTMAHAENQAWLAGAPGNRILRSTDFGQSWVASVAPSTMPLHDLHFASSPRGWAVGARGTILSTKDAGQTWDRQRAGTSRDALLGIFATEREIPWELIAQAAARDEYRTHIVLIATCDDSRRTSLVRRLQHAATLVGATAEVLTPARLNPDVDLPAERVMAEWQLRQPSALDWLSERITLLMRTRRPAVVLTSEWGHRHGESSGAARLTSRLVADACDYAESEHAFPDQLVGFGIVPWPVARAVVCVEKMGAKPVPRSKRKTGLGQAPEDLALHARRILGQVTFPSAWTLRSLRDESTGDLGTQPFAGLVVEYGSVARRARPDPRAARHGRTDLAFAMARAGSKGMQRIEQIESLAVGDTLAAGRILFDLAEVELETAERELLLRQLVTRHPDHPLANAAFFQLVRKHTSVERMWFEYEQQLAPLPAVLLADVQEQRAGDSDDVQLASAEAPAFEEDWTRGLRLLQEINSKWPTLSSEPEIAFPLATLPRSSSHRPSSSRFQQQLFPNGWPQYAKLEMMLVGSMESESHQQTAIWNCRSATARPHLDGDLSDEIWKSAEFRTLLSIDPINSRQPMEPTRVGMTKDAKYLYLAIHCPKRSGIDYHPMRKQRPRDADLSGHDRIRVHLDINRDYVSWWSFTFDDRGWTNDGLNDDLSWNPKYYVAAKSDARAWVIEAAIPLDSLAPEEYRDGTYWAMGLERIVPKSHVERWISANDRASTPNLQGILHLE